MLVDVENESQRRDWHNVISAYSVRLVDKLSDLILEGLRHRRIQRSLRVPRHIYPYLLQSTIEYDLHRVIELQQKDIREVVLVLDDEEDHLFLGRVPILSMEKA